MSDPVSCGQCKYFKPDRIRFGLESGFCKAKWFEFLSTVPEAFDYPVSNRMIASKKHFCGGFKAKQLETVDE